MQVGDKILLIEIPEKLKSFRDNTDILPDITDVGAITDIVSTDGFLAKIKGKLWYFNFDNNYNSMKYITLNEFRTKKKLERIYK